MYILFHRYLDDIGEIVYHTDFVVLSPSRLFGEVLGRALRPHSEGPRQAALSDFTREARNGVVPYKVVCVKRGWLESDMPPFDKCCDIVICCQLD